jgi:SM-20-related protein
MSRQEYNPLWNDKVDSLIKAIPNKGFWLCRDFLAAEHLEPLYEYCRVLDESNALKEAAIGKGELKRNAPSIRSDQIAWFDDFDSETGKVLFDVYDELMNILRCEFFLPVKRFECHFAKYETGAKYLKHVDRHTQLPGRLITCVLYLSQCSKKSGNLKVYLPNGDIQTVAPAPGTLVVFNSELEHEVTPALTDRWSVAGWVRDDLHSGIRI